MNRWTSKHIEDLKKKGNIRGWSLGMEFVPRKECIVCGSKFYCAPVMEKRGGNAGKFCSKKCSGIFQSKKYEIQRDGALTKKEQRKNEKRQRALEKQKLSEEKKSRNSCPFCGKPCERIFCNKTCYAGYKNINRKDNRITKNCLNCGKEIKVSNGQHNAGFGKFCSTSCSAVHRVNKGTISLYSNSKGGKRSDLDNRYFRSRWEANYARYLNLLVSTGDILKWEYETKTFYFENIKRGTRSYTPDFKVYTLADKYKFIEIKGYMDSKSITKLKRMAKYYPEETVEVIDGTRYKALSKSLKKIIPNWEVDQKKCY